MIFKKRIKIKSKKYVPVSAEFKFLSKSGLTCAKFRVPLIRAIDTMMNVVANQIVINAGIC